MPEAHVPSCKLHGMLTCTLDNIKQKCYRRRLSIERGRLHVVHCSARALKSAHLSILSSATYQREKLQAREPERTSYREGVDLEWNVAFRDPNIEHCWRGTCLACQKISEEYANIG
jgi:hypothetical protein